MTCAQSYSYTYHGYFILVEEKYYFLFVDGFMFLYVLK